MYPSRCARGAVADDFRRLQSEVAELQAAATEARRPFAWEDGPLVTAMRDGDVILIDELNLAEDAVVERLNRCPSLPPSAPAAAAVAAPWTPGCHLI